MASYRCTTCEYTTARWMGFCPQCRTTGTLSEQKTHAGDTLPIAITEVAPAAGEQRLATGIDEFDRVLGG
ncbi:MAG: DNA repair protein RadA, partial [Acidobacteria bacterium]|nr:DNA repair protein RadA [Acidobacteriota bacterium]